MSSVAASTALGKRISLPITRAYQPVKPVSSSGRPSPPDRAAALLRAFTLRGPTRLPSVGRNTSAMTTDAEST